MRWFKHYSNSAFSTSGRSLRSHIGWEGYGILMGILETISGEMANSDDYSVTMSIKDWCNILGIRSQKLRSLLAVFDLLRQDCARTALTLEYDYNDNLLTIRAPKLSEFKDEWTRKKSKNSGVAPEKLPPLDIDIDIDIDNRQKLLLIDPIDSSESIGSIRSAPKSIVGKPVGGEVGVDSIDSAPVASEPEPDPDPLAYIAELNFPLPDGSSMRLHKNDIARFRERYPEIDIAATFHAAREYLFEKPERRYPAGGLRVFLHNWCQREVDRYWEQKQLAWTASNHSGPVPDSPAWWAKHEAETPTAEQVRELFPDAPLVELVRKPNGRVYQ